MMSLNLLTLAARLRPAPGARLLAAAFIGLNLLVISKTSAVQMPVRVFTTDATRISKSFNVALDSSKIADVEYLYLQVHGLRYGGQLSVKVNSDPYLQVYNHTVLVMEPEYSQGGIGGINHTISFLIDLSNSTLLTNNVIRVRLNGTDGDNNAIRVLDADLRDDNLNSLLTAGEVLHADTESVTGAQWSPYSTNNARISNGEKFWEGDSSIFDKDKDGNGTNDAYLISDPINETVILASCASCHFDDGGDLIYFNYSNDAIVSRAMYHGVSENNAKDIVSYLRSLGNPNPGRPWNPPFQPGAGLDPNRPGQAAARGEAWMAGAGLGAVVSTEQEVFDALFPGGGAVAEIAQVIDHEKEKTPLSVREIPVRFQFPDWNEWLPKHALEDLWYNTNYAEGITGGIDTLFDAKDDYRTAIDNGAAATRASNGELNETVGDFYKAIDNWLDPYRLPANTPPSGYNNKIKQVLNRSDSPVSERDQIISAVGRWRAVKMMDGVRANGLETVFDDTTAMVNAGHVNYTEELMSIPGDNNLAGVFGLAAHIASDNRDHFVGQPEAIGKMESNQWYTVQLVMNTGSRIQGNMNTPLDWDYQLNHLMSAADRTGETHGMTLLATYIKMMQQRDNGAGVKQKGYSQRTLHPFNFFSDDDRGREIFKGVMDQIRPGLWRDLFEEVCHEWFDVVTQWEVDDTTYLERLLNRNNFDPEGQPPLPFDVDDDSLFFWSNGSVAKGTSSVTWFYRLLPLLHQERIDEMLLLDFVDYCEALWSPQPNYSYENKDGNTVTVQLYTDSNGNTGWRVGGTTDIPGWASLFAADSLFYERFETGSAEFGSASDPVTRQIIRNTDWGKNSAAVPSNGGGRFIASRNILANETTRTRSTADLGIALPSGVGDIEIGARVAYESNNSNSPTSVRYRMQVKTSDGTSTSNNNSAWMTLPSDLDGEEFITYRDVLNVSGETEIVRVRLDFENTGGAGTVYVDNVYVREKQDASVLSESGTPPGTPQLATSFNSTFKNIRARLVWGPHYTADIVGYNIHRWEENLESLTKVKINEGPIDIPFYNGTALTGNSSPEYEHFDYTVKEGKTYVYKVVGVDAGGTESATSATATALTITDEDDPTAPGTLWLDDTPDPNDATKGDILLRWFGTPTWDIAGFDVYTSTDGTTYTLATTLPRTSLQWNHADVDFDGTTYYYYVQAIDINGRAADSEVTQITP